MKSADPKNLQMERQLEQMLHYGTWAACAAIAAGLAFMLFHSPLGTLLVGGGIVLFILLPVLRVIVMLIAFWRERDYHFCAVAALVLVILLAGFAFAAIN